MVFRAIEFWNNVKGGKVKDKTPVMAVSEIIKMLELLTLFNKENDLDKLQGIIQDIITTLKKQSKGVNL